MSETAVRGFATRTRWNVRDSDATLILNLGALEGGTATTVRAAVALGKPYLVIDLAAVADPETVRRWLADHDAGTLNVAGPRESRRPGITALARDFMDRLLASR